MKHALCVSSIFAYVGGRWCIMLRKLRCMGLGSCIIDVRSVCYLAATQHGAKVVWHALQMMFGTLDVYIHITCS